MTRDGQAPRGWRVGILQSKEKVLLCSAPSASSSSSASSKRIGWTACCAAPRVVTLYSSRRGLTSVLRFPCDIAALGLRAKSKHQVELLVAAEDGCIWVELLGKSNVDHKQIMWCCTDLSYCNVRGCLRGVQNVIPVGESRWLAWGELLDSTFISFGEDPSQIMEHRSLVDPRDSDIGSPLCAVLVGLDSYPGVCKLNSTLFTELFGAATSSTILLEAFSDGQVMWTPLTQDRKCTEQRRLLFQAPDPIVCICPNGSLELVLVTFDGRVALLNSIARALEAPYSWLHLSVCIDSAFTAKSMLYCISGYQLHAISLTQMKQSCLSQSVIARTTVIASNIIDCASFSGSSQFAQLSTHGALTILGPESLEVAHVPVPRFRSLRKVLGALSTISDRSSKINQLRSAMDSNLQALATAAECAMGLKKLIAALSLTPSSFQVGSDREFSVSITLTNETGKEISMEHCMLMMQMRCSSSFDARATMRWLNLSRTIPCGSSETLCTSMNFSEMDSTVLLSLYFIHLDVHPFHESKAPLNDVPLMFLLYSRTLSIIDYHVPTSDSCLFLPSEVKLCLHLDRVLNSISGQFACANDLQAHTKSRDLIPCETKLIIGMPTWWQGVNVREQTIGDLDISILCGLLLKHLLCDDKNASNGRDEAVLGERSGAVIKLRSARSAAQIRVTHERIADDLNATSGIRVLAVVLDCTNASDLPRWRLHLLRRIASLGRSMGVDNRRPQFDASKATETRKQWTENIDGGLLLRILPLVKQHMNQVVRLNEEMDGVRDGNSMSSRVVSSHQVREIAVQALCIYSLSRQSLIASLPL